MKRAHWGSKLGFVLAVAGSAVGLANIWRFPYIVGENGGAAFIIVYLLCLALIGIPSFIAEITIGRATQTNPSSAFRLLGGNRVWQGIGKITILTGFIVSAFYSAVAGWILGYLFEAISGTLVSFQTHDQAEILYQALMESPWWSVAFHGMFMAMSVGILYFGVKNGIERCNKFLMPLLFIILITLVFKGLSLPNSFEGISFLLKPNWSLITPATLLIALGQSFFTLSIGQGTLVTYGSYLSKKESIIGGSLPVVLVDTIVSILAACAVFTIVFSAGIPTDQGPSLIFNTLPLVFSQMQGGYLVSILFFVLIVVAALTSEISALEPLIAYLCDEWKWDRHKATLACGMGAFVLGVPCALSKNVLQHVHLMGDQTILDTVMELCSNILIPLGGLAAVILLSWKWGTKKVFEELNVGTQNRFQENRFLQLYLKVCFRYVSPLLIIIVFLSAIGMI